eukprot:3882414-Karenia_brevis.AAC.1
MLRGDDGAKHGQVHWSTLMFLKTVEGYVETLHVEAHLFFSETLDMLGDGRTLHWRIKLSTRMLSNTFWGVVETLHVEARMFLAIYQENPMDNAT